MLTVELTYLSLTKPLTPSPPTTPPPKVKDKKDIYRYHKLSREDKVALYAARPDLDPKTVYTRVKPKICEPLLTNEDRSMYDQADEQPPFDPVMDYLDASSDCSTEEARAMSTEMGVGIAGGVQTPHAVRNPIRIHQAPATPRDKQQLIEFVRGSEDTESSSDEEDEEDVEISTPVGSMIQEFFSRSPPSGPSAADEKH